MRKGVKISIRGTFDHNIFDEFILQRASKLGIQGSLQVFDNNNLLVYAVGETESVEFLIDDIYGDASGANVEELNVKPLDEDKDFRGIFRVINKRD
jgi:acylphosphatase